MAVELNGIWGLKERLLPIPYRGEDLPNLKEMGMIAGVPPSVQHNGSTIDGENEWLSHQTQKS